MPERQDYRRLFEESPTPTFVYARAGYRFLAVNGSALAQYGYTREEFLSLTALDIRPKSEIPAFLSSNSSLPDNYQSAGTFLHCTRRGEPFWVQIYTRCTNFMNEDAVLVLAINIDEKVRVERALAEKTRETESILESITDGFFTLDSQWRFLYVNAETERLTGMSRDKMLGRNAWDLFPAGKESRFYTEYSKVIKEKVSVHFQELFPDLSMWVQVNAYPSGDGLSVYFRDITDERKKEEQLFNDRQNLVAIINNTRDIIWSVDKDNHIISANTPFWERVGKIVGKPVSEISESDYSSESYAEWLPYFQTAMQGETYTIIREEEMDGQKVFEEVSFNPIYDRDGAVSGVSCFLRDVTEQRKYLQKIEQQNMQLKEIAWMQSHRIRRHTANILGLASLLDLDEAVQGENPQIIRKLQLSAMQLDDILHEISNSLQDNKEKN